MDMPELLATIRDAILKSGETPYAICKRSGVARSQVSRLLSGQAGMSVANVERLADALGLRITVSPKQRRKGR
jgi:transcriptional regulator with XRE-family HTH domain